ncbi:MAG: hypothetical protein AAB618_03180 [Patescibacteria group bacterium]
MLRTKYAIEIENNNFHFIEAEASELPGLDNAILVEFTDTRNGDRRKLLAAVIHLPHQYLVQDHSNWVGYPIASTGGKIKVSFSFLIHAGGKYLFAFFTSQSLGGEVLSRLHGLGAYE